MNNTELLYRLMEMCYVQKEDEYGGVDWILDKNRVKLIQIVSDKIKEAEKEHKELNEFKKRDIKMKPKLIDYATQHYLCPVCNETISIDENETFNKIFYVFCKYCGQRLDWERIKEVKNKMNKDKEG